MELFKAHNQWASRPADETFESVEAMHTACHGYRQSARTAKVQLSSLRVEANDGEIQLVGKTGVPAKLTHWAFGQICQRASAPASYLRDLPATLAAQNLNHGLANAAKTTTDEESKSASLLFHQNGSLVLRAATSEKYSRIWNSDVTSRALQLQRDQPNWKLPLAYDLHNSRGMVPRGAYASDHDMFLFLVDEARPVEAKGCPKGLNRGFFLWNSEVGAASFGIQVFLYDYVCGNHIVWGASKVSELRIRHIGESVNDRAFGQFKVQVRRFAESSTSDMQAKILAAQTRILGTNKDEVLDAILGKRIPELTRKRLGEAYDAAEKVDRYGSPRTVWGMVNGLTEISQSGQHADSRVALDRAAGRVLELAF